LIGAVLSVWFTILFISSYRPKVEIGLPYFDAKTLKFKIINTCDTNFVSNINIEVAVLINNFTYHLKTDRDTFLMLAPKKNLEINKTDYERVFRIVDVEDFTKSIALNCQNLDDVTQLLENEKAYLRIRVYAQHEFTGFGKVFESHFQLSKENNEFQRK
jgi:hypothetical protein